MYVLKKNIDDDIWRGRLSNLHVDIHSGERRRQGERREREGRVLCQEELPEGSLTFSS